MDARRPPAPLPVTVLTGFLGAGKTTLLQRLLADPAMAGTAVIVNEFGEVGLDHLLVETADEAIVTLVGGCVCCQVQGDLMDALERLLRGRDNHRIAAFSRVVIETTGLADPAPILQATMRHPYLSLRYEIAGVVALVEAPGGRAAIERHDEARRQIAVADRLVLSKTDLCAKRAAPAELVKVLRGLNPRAPILDAMKGEATAERLFGKVVPGVGPVSGERDHDQDHDHDHDAPTDGLQDHLAGRGISSFVLEAAAPLGRAALERFISLVCRRHGPSLLRVKGLVALAEAPDRPAVVQGVQHVFAAPRFLEAWPAGERRTRLVVITQHGDEPAIRALFAAILDNRPEVLAAIEPDNPLATPGSGAFRP